MLGVPYGNLIDRAEGVARDQARTIAAEIAEQGGPDDLADKEIVALTAYLQRLGTDLFKAPPDATKEGAPVALTPTPEALARGGALVTPAEKTHAAQ